MAIGSLFSPDMRCTQGNMWASYEFIWVWLFWSDTQFI